MDTIRDRMLRCKQVLSEGEMLEDYNFSKEKQQEIMDFMWEYKESLNEISLRMITKIADLAKMSDNWKKLARVTCMKRSSAV
jgi:hypoxanthine phosphoribosyltransferase